MRKPLDDAMKKLVGGNPQDFASWVLPLLPMTKDGARREVVEEMIRRLVGAEKTDALWIGYALASKVFRKDNLKWLKRRFAMFSDILRDTPVYQEVFEEGREEGRQEALSKALQRQRRALLDVISGRFPKIVRSVRKQIDSIEDSEILWSLITKMSMVQTAEEAKQLILSAREGKTKS